MTISLAYFALAAIIFNTLSFALKFVIYLQLRLRDMLRAIARTGKSQIFRSSSSDG